MKYPAEFVTDDGKWWVIFEGHGLGLLDMAKAVTEHLGERPVGQTLIKEEQHLRLVPRIKWCSRLDGWSCDQEGEWHAHWFGVRPGTSTAFTIARWSDRRSPDSGEGDR